MENRCRSRSCAGRFGGTDHGYGTAGGWDRLVTHPMHMPMQNQLCARLGDGGRKVFAIEQRRTANDRTGHRWMMNQHDPEALLTPKLDEELMQRFKLRFSQAANSEMCRTWMRARQADECRWPSQPHGGEIAHRGQRF